MSVKFEIMKIEHLKDSSVLSTQTWEIIPIII